MTYIAIGTSASAARISTDGWSYSPNGRWFGRSSKVHPIPHLKAALTGSMGVRLGAEVAATMDVVAGEVASFDELVQVAQEVLWGVWTANPDPTCQAISILVGWSDSAARYKAVGFGSLSLFRPHDLGDFFVTPTPYDMRPHELELQRLVNYDVGPKHLETMRGRPAPGPAPTSTAGWVELAEKVRLHRARSTRTVTRLKVFVGGDLYMTTLDRGGVSTKVIHTFNDTGAEFAEVVSGTMHPVALAGPCPCESGKTYLECHVAPALDEPCCCGSGTLTRDCCAADALQATTTVSAA